MEEVKSIHEQIFEEDEMEHGCGYWSVCCEHACPCSPSAAVSQGFSEEVWENLAKESEDLRADYDKWADDFIGSRGPWVFDHELGVYYQD